MDISATFTTDCYGRRGATLGSEGEQAALFRDEMISFFRRTLRLI
jgi:hypothetical protein